MYFVICAFMLVPESRSKFKRKSSYYMQRFYIIKFRNKILANYLGKCPTILTKCLAKDTINQMLSVLNFG